MWQQTLQEQKEIMIAPVFYGTTHFLDMWFGMFFCLWACRTVWGEYADGSPSCGLLQHQLVRLPTPAFFSETTVHLAVIALSVLLESGMTAVLTAHANLEDNCKTCTFCSSAGSSSVWLSSFLLIFYMNICKSMPVFRTMEGPGTMWKFNYSSTNALAEAPLKIKYINSVMVLHIRTKFYLAAPQILNQFIQCGIKRWGQSKLEGEGCIFF